MTQALAALLPTPKPVQALNRKGRGVGALEEGCSAQGFSGQGDIEVEKSFVPSWPCHIGLQQEYGHELCPPLSALSMAGHLFLTSKLQNFLTTGLCASFSSFLSCG